MAHPSDLLTRAASGDRAAFTELMGQTRVALFRFIRRYIGYEQDAFDLSHDTYASAWLNIRKYDPA